MKRILLIEDNNEIRENTAEILELDGYEVLTAENGKIGVELAASSKPDLIICDIMMPVLDGYSVLHLLSKNPDTENIPFIFLTAKADRQDFRKGMEMGADDYITKPFDDVDLLNAIESRFKKMELLEKKYSRNIDGLNNLVRDVGGEQELKNLTNNREKRKYKKKSEIFREGDFPLYLFYIEQGKIKTYKTNEDGKELIINLHNEGDFFGYVNLMRENSYMESAAALEDCEITLIPKSEFFKLIHQNRQVSQKFIKMLSDNIKENEDQLLKLAYNSVRKRVSECLIKFFEQNEDKKPVNGLKISREDLSNMAGTSIETAIRTLSDFKDEKLIEISSGKIKILDLEKLRRLKN
ncbi:response regulator [Lacihabitans soyangensis]|jgi:CRP-like cAMP-binding protein|uniref:Response regulator n=1 Tax=Lacihabitans soyangensis TaxID=869394 RepID=A0AAE3H4H2_9BACT|nr:response regulator [Lacihabitans soyangensis]MCP9764792.1 response regulator [Lacihabitans soyangensis]